MRERQHRQSKPYNGRVHCLLSAFWGWTGVGGGGRKYCSFEGVQENVEQARFSSPCVCSAGKWQKLRQRVTRTDQHRKNHERIVANTQWPSEEQGQGQAHIYTDNKEQVQTNYCQPNTRAGINKTQVRVIIKWSPFLWNRSKTNKVSASGTGGTHQYKIYLPDSSIV